MLLALFDLPFVRGFLAGLALAAPMGPVAVLCVRRALAGLYASVLAIGLAAALVDMIFGAVAGLGLTIVTRFILDHETAIGLIGGVIVIAVGIIVFRTPARALNGENGAPNMRREFATTFGIGITNPATMIAAIGLFAAFAPVDLYTAPMTAGALVAGVFTGSAAWWLILATATHLLR
ncbi:MAG: LysE family transporter, partial [Rhodospirillaceae bacterium]